jgi:uncharacterized radical SAM superfamily Fe-S cluster-containing enzyme
MNLIKKTKSVCPECLDVIDADILEKKDGIWMFKECKKHRKFKGFVEKDPVFYKKTVDAFFKITKNTLLNEGPYSLIKSFFSRYGPHVLFYNRGRPGYFNKLKNTKTLDINIWHWPDRYNIDLNEINSHEVNHMTYDGDILNFNEAMIRSKEL